MSKFRIGTYNVQNLFDRFDDPYSTSDDRYYGRFSSSPKSRSKMFDIGMRIRENGVKPSTPIDIVGLQEIENFGALLDFVQASVGPQYGAKTGVFSQPSNDQRGIDLGVLVRSDLFRLGRVTSHRFKKFKRSDGETYQFGRDCLQVEVLFKETKQLFLTAFICHFKSKFTPVDRFSDPDGYAEEQRKNDLKRNAEAREVVRIIKNEVDVDEDLFVVLGDLNDTPKSAPLEPLLSNGDVDQQGDGLALQNGVSLLHQDINSPSSESRRARDTHYWDKPINASGETVSDWAQIDYILCSDRLWELRTGVAGVDNSPRSQGSDHYLSYVEFEIPNV